MDQLGAGMFATNADVAAAPRNAASAPPASRAARETSALLAQACQQRDGAATRLFVLVYDDETQSVATRWRQNLIDLPGNAGLRIVPVKNVTRDAELHQQRRPVPWPKPTFVLHDPASRACAQAMQHLLAPRVVDAVPGADAENIWIRDLPDAQPNRRPGVIEFWWPTGSIGMASAASGSAELIARFEGAVLTPYTDGAGQAAIGTGHVLTPQEVASGTLFIGGAPVEFAAGISATQARQLLEADLTPYRDQVAQIVSVKLTKNQHEALASLAFNIGIGTLKKSQLISKLNAGKYDEVPAEMMRWTRVAGSAVPDLVSRREAEIALWNKP